MTGTKKLSLILAAFFSLTSTGWSGLIIGFDPADLLVTSTGADQVVDLGILIDWDGVGENTLSGFTLDFSEASPDLQVIQTIGFAPGQSDFTWSVNSGVNATSISGLNGANHIIDMSGTQMLATLQFTLDGSFTSGVIPILLAVNNAQRNGLNPIPDGEILITGNGGDLVVSGAAVPEPASLAMMGLAACGAMGLRRRRKGAPSEQAV